MTIAQIGAQIFVGAVVAAITAFINKIIQEKFNFWIILGVVATVVILYGILITEGNAPPFIAIAVTLCAIFSIALAGYITGFGSPPFIEWRVKLTPAQWNVIREQGGECPGLISDGDLIGKTEEQACQFRCQHFNCDVYGPYIYLPRCKYKAVFRIKMGRTSDNDGGIEINVAASDNNGNWGAKPLKSSHIPYTKFKRADTYYSCSLDFDAFDKGESKVEFRIHCKERGPVMMLDYIRLYRRLF